MNRTVRRTTTRWLAALAVAFASARFAHGQVQVDTLTWVDSVRQRPVPVAFYHAGADTRDLPVVLFSHGYNENRPGAYLHYSHLAGAMAEAGWFVVSVQHELPTDEPLPLTGVPHIVRRPSWERGVANLLFVLDRLQRTHPELDLKRLTVMGHSQGGDISMLFAAEHPERLERVLSLDNRRMPLPRTARPIVCSVRSADMPPDEGVLPTPAEQQRLGIRIIRSTVPHNDMDDDASPEQRAELQRAVLRLLGEQPVR